MPDLSVIVPTRGRPGNIRKVISAWDFTGAWSHADLTVVVDQDDPEFQRYHEVVADVLDSVPDGQAGPIRLLEVPIWVPMVGKLNLAATSLAPRYRALAFAGDDHLPRTIGWAAHYLEALEEMGTGMVYGDDGYQGRKLATEWCVTSDVVSALGRMVPAPVDHLYCDNAMMDLFRSAGALRHLPEIRIEHAHPATGRVQSDDQYRRVNSKAQYQKDRATYSTWKSQDLAGQAARVRQLRRGRPDVPVTPSPSRATADRRPAVRKKDNMGKIGPKEFRKVRGATPDEIGLALADFALRVPQDQAIVELGVFQGRTALLMAWGARQGNRAHVWGIDPWDSPGNVYDPPFTEAGSRHWAAYNVQATGYSQDVTLIRGFSRDIAERWEGPHVGLLFVDGDHTKEGARGDIEAWLRHLAAGAVIAVDDYGHADWPGVKEAVDELVQEGILAPVEVYHDRLAVTRVADRTNGRVTAVTSEGVAPSPYPAVSGQVADLEPEAAREVLPRGLEPDRMVVSAGEMKDVAAGTPVPDLNTVQLRALAKVRGISLGARKDRRGDMLQALQDGR